MLFLLRSCDVGLYHCGMTISSPGVRSMYTPYSPHTESPVLRPHLVAWKEVHLALNCSLTYFRCLWLLLGISGPAKMWPFVIASFLSYASVLERSVVEGSRKNPKPDPGVPGGKASEGRQH